MHYHRKNLSRLNADILRLLSSCSVRDIKTEDCVGRFPPQSFSLSTKLVITRSAFKVIQRLGSPTLFESSNEFSVQGALQTPLRSFILFRDECFNQRRDAHVTHAVIFCQDTQ